MSTSILANETCDPRRAGAHGLARSGSPWLQFADFKRQKSAKALLKRSARKFPLDFVEVLHTLTLHCVDVFKHYTAPNMRLVNLIIQPLVHGLFGLAEPSQQVRMLLDLCFEVFKIKVFLIARKLLENFFNVSAIQCN